MTTSLTKIPMPISTIPNTLNLLPFGMLLSSLDRMRFVLSTGTMGLFSAFQIFQGASINEEITTCAWINGKHLVSLPSDCVPVNHANAFPILPTKWSEPTLNAATKNSLNHSFSANQSYQAFSKFSDIPPPIAP